MVIYFARLVSFLFNPYFLIIPVPYLLVLRETGDGVIAMQWTLFSLFFLAIVGIAVFVLFKRGYFSDLDISKKEQRPLFFLLVCVFAICYFLGLFYLRGPLVLFISLSGLFFSLLVFSFLVTKVKASIHVATITAMIFSFSVLYGGQFFLLLFLIPLIGWSRIKIHRHTWIEVMVGAVLGIVIPVVMFVVFKVLLHVSL
ncbi:MAG: hypothetical protein AAB478_02105 [Patescibacteria group bacterium]